MSLINAIKTNDSHIVSDNLSQYKEQGIIDPMLVIKSIPFEDRLPQLVKRCGRFEVAKILNVALTVAFEKMNLKYAMNASQIVELVEQVIDSSEEDQLSIEDVMLFLQQLIRGEMGKLYDRMDIPKFFELFEVYRQRRHEQYMAAKEEFNAQCKALPVNERLADLFGTEKQRQRDVMNEYLIGKGLENDNKNSA